MVINLDNTVWRQGYRDYCKGLKVEQCSYSKGTKEWDLWISGHSAAEFNSEH